MKVYTSTPTYSTRVPDKKELEAEKAQSLLEALKELHSEGYISDLSYKRAKRKIKNRISELKKFN